MINISIISFSLKWNSSKCNLACKRPTGVDGVPETEDRVMRGPRLLQAGWAPVSLMVA